jgi:hypothetical protein
MERTGTVACAMLLLGGAGEGGALTTVRTFTGRPGVLLNVSAQNQYKHNEEAHAIELEKNCN